MENTPATVLEQLYTVIQSRKTASGEISYTARLMEQGVEKINAKIEEEAGEVTDAARSGEAAHLVHEIADLLFHVLVLASFKNISLERIAAELTRRFGKSGLEEKAERGEKEKN